MDASEGCSRLGVRQLAGEAVAETAAEMGNIVAEMKVQAVSKLEALADHVGMTDTISMAQTMMDTCGALVAPTLGLVGEAMRDRAAKGTDNLWRVREVAVLKVLRVAQALRDDGGGGGGGGGGEWDEARRETLEALQAVLLRSAVYETTPQVRALLTEGAALAAELHTCASQAPQTATPQTAAAASLAMEEERHGAWADTRKLVQLEVEQRLRQLEKLRTDAEREPDVLKKQLKLAECRTLHSGLAQCSTNIRDVGTALGVVVGFLTVMDSKLDVLGSQLSELQATVRELGADMKRLVGRPVLEELDEQLKERLAALQQLRSEVYVPAEGVKADENGKFIVSDDNKAFDLMDKVKTDFLASDKSSVLLLSGPAGSGKSTFEHELRGYLETKWAQQSEKQGRGKVVVLAVSLPTLRNPLGDLFYETLASKGLRDAQIAELREKAMAGAVRLVFLLDGYDEMKSECLFKNLYTANNLEQYRSRSGAGLGDPKVIISTRTELLSQNAHYERSFTPVTDGVGGGARAASGMLELRMGKFHDKLQTYVHAHVALQLRREWEKRVGALLPLTPELAWTLIGAAGGAGGGSGRRRRRRS
jgi:hypothetical protein